uniref:BPI2 domain-containing protein n=1 Tax=Steinernema glaseri TaxID=37863 RepID=A0A1I8AR05_9BILA
MSADMRLWIRESRIVGNATIDKLDFKLLHSEISDVDESSFADLGFLGAEFLEKVFTEALQVGIVMPTVKGVVLRNPKLSLHDRYVLIQSYFKLDETYAGKVIRGAVRKATLNGR